MSDSLERLYLAVIAAKDLDPATSRTARLFQRGPSKMAKKLAAAKTPPKTSLTTGDRYWMRCVAVALIVIGPMIALGRFDVARATWRHGLWWLPTHYEPTTTHGGPLSIIGSGVPRTVDVFGTPPQRVPSDA